MSTLQMEFMETIEGLSDDTMRILLEVVKQVVLPLIIRRMPVVHLKTRANRAKWAASKGRGLSQRDMI